jgi:hypothetical protein
MSLRNQWNAAQRRNLQAQLRSTSRAFADALPAEEAVDGLIMNFHLCLALELTRQEMQDIFGRRVLAFLAMMTAAAQTEGRRPRYAVDPTAGLGCRRPLAETKIGKIGADGELHPDDAHRAPGLDDGTIHVLFRRNTGRRAS